MSDIYHVVYCIPAKVKVKAMSVAQAVQHVKHGLPATGYMIGAFRQGEPIPEDLEKFFPAADLRGSGPPEAA